MIHVVTSANRGLYRDELQEHFRIRHDIYVGERGWTALERADGLERDQFDTDDAVYILGIDGGRVVGGSRLVPTVKPHLLADIFPHLAAQRGVPRDPAIFEWTRIFVIKERREGRNSGRTAGSIMCGLLEHCLDQGVSGLTAIIETWWLPRFHDMGWTLHPLGLPDLIDGSWTVAVMMPIDEATLDSTRAFHSITAPVLTQKGPQRPAAREVLS
jgi:acyl-homoserine lactone synthase